MNKSEFAVLTKLNQHVDHFDNYADMAAGNGAAPALVPQKGNPSFGAQFALSNFTLAFSVAVTVFTRINFSALPAGWLSAMFWFGNSDFQSGYPQAKQLVPLTVGTYGTPFIYGRDYPTVLVNGVLTVIDATVTALLLPGDVCVPITVRSGGVDYVTLSVHRCQQVEYATLLAANVSNSMNQKGIRMILQSATDTATLAQFNQALFNFNRSWLGKFERDSTDINSNNQPANFKANVIDIPLTLGINKASGLAGYVTLSGISGNTLQIILSVFVNNAINPQK
jgi:hypothetical protein